mgnify:CR=1 FL=1
MCIGLEYSKTLNRRVTLNKSGNTMLEIKGNKRGEESDETLLEIIKNYPGLSQYELG